MQLQSSTSSQNILHMHNEDSTNFYKEERRRTGRYLAGGVALTIILIAIYHVLGRTASTIAGIWSPAIIMASYILWVFYAARKDRIKALRLTSAVNSPKIQDASNVGHMTSSDNTINSHKSSAQVIIV